ncbi:hypothetical protein COOONC_09414 [Cooperia oncophora]
MSPDDPSKRAEGKRGLRSLILSRFHVHSQTSSSPLSFSEEAVMNNPRIPACLTEGYHITHLTSGASVLKEESRNADLFTSPVKLHITVCVLWLFDEEEQKKAIDVMNECRGDLL